MSISPFPFTFQKSFCEKPFLKTTLHDTVLCHVYVVKQSCGKIPNKNCLKAKACGFASVAA